ncbi:MAG TPA: hypothetical protein VF532_12265 [Candidatus Angelobacter sp.]
MKALKWIFLIAGLALFAISFKLPAIKEIAKPGATGNTLYGFNCAALALRLPWGKEGMTFFHSEPVTYFAVLISGWINPVFVLGLLVLLIRPGSRLNWLFRLLIPLMFVACWIVFQKIHFYAYTGFYAWMCGILMAMFSDLWVKRPAAVRIAES